MQVLPVATIILPEANEAVAVVPAIARHKWSWQLHLSGLLKWTPPLQERASFSAFPAATQTGEEATLLTAVGDGITASANTSGKHVAKSNIELLPAKKTRSVANKALLQKGGEGVPVAA